MPADRLAAAVLNLPAPWQGQFFDVVGSTQDLAREAARSGAPSRSLFIADYQTAGRGRSNRRWLASTGSALMMSILFRAQTETPTLRPWRYTSLTSLALLGTIAVHVPEAVAAIKWPNDVMLLDRKVAGVLAETSWNGQELQVIVGAGLNVSAAPPDVPGAISLSAATARPLDRGDLLLTFVSQVDALFGEPDETVFARWASRLWGRGQRLRLVDSGDRDQDVVVLGARLDGSLHVRYADGSEGFTTTGELLA
jgi:BirA family biotin operon repressor/biotin-[acetyl-CoA-carboxylase] ligase